MDDLTKHLHDEVKESNAMKNQEDKRQKAGHADYQNRIIYASEKLIDIYKDMKTYGISQDDINSKSGMFQV